MADRATTLPELLTGLADSDRKVLFPTSGATLPHRALPALARSTGALLTAKGVVRDEVVGLLIPTGPEWLSSFFGVSMIGAVVSTLPLPPVVLDPEAVAQGLLPIVAAADLRHLVVAGVGRAVGAALAEARPELAVIDVTEVPAGNVPDVPVRPHDRAVVQFSSGSTARPKGVVLTHQAMLTGVSAINTHIQTVPEDLLVGWVPLFHDMGLVSLLCSLLTPCDAHLFGPQSFIRDPGAIVEHIAEAGGTIVTGPNFSYDKFVEAAQGRSLDLSRWRLALNGAETVRPDTVTDFQRTFGPCGVPSSTMYPCYGMAEATLAVTLPKLGTPPRMLTVDRERTELNGPVVFDERGRRLVGVGVAVPGMEIAIAGTDGEHLPEGWLGEIHIRGAAVTRGYLGETPRADDDWLSTGDLGFLDNGELFIVGRRKEMIIVRGRNFFPDEVENSVRDLDVVHRGHCVAVAHPFEERIVVVAETAAQTGAEAGSIQGAVQSALGLAAVDVVLVPPRSLPRTTSGKWQRTLVAELVRRHLTDTPPQEDSS
ncbi:AMP-binding protein [Amycolatopsis sp. EV170708-02-1]|uniref:AMP-binding protein n=1 Tax=Amycolatopsis sp. EV170708-02-1 TaxID=2919322 RepID=UPI001F0BC301|nr:AMP-binding protein [Amycolatopsis sp. EV170708-02-1]UMP06994.1 AMP-binding protein [Amycolatopsis sp. EV170708-02-1]